MSNKEKLEQIAVVDCRKSKRIKVLQDGVGEGRFESQGTGLLGVF